jgi:uncharacterized protein YkwD
MGRLRALIVTTAIVAATGLGLVPLATTTAPVGAVVNPTPTIDPMSRASVLAAYQTSLEEARTVPVGWTGNVGSCTKGAESAASTVATRAAFNFYRGLVGLPAVTINETKNDQARAAALMMQANNQINHFPPDNWNCWTQQGDTAAASSNLAQGLVGAGAIDIYMADLGAGNYFAGHRRTMLHPSITNIGTGSTTGFNALRVYDDVLGPRPVGPTWIAWPNAGFVPKRALRPFTFAEGTILFSLSSNVYPDADYSSATVTVKVGSTFLAVDVNPLVPNYGDNTLTWDVTPPANYDSSDADVKFDITVSGMKQFDGTPIPTYSYSSTAFVNASSATVPGAPTGVTATAGNAQANVSWTAPAANGGSAITGYRVTPYIGATAQTVRVFSGTATTHAVTGLTNGTAYTFKVQAVNAIGNSALSTASAAVTPATTPGVPTSVSAVAGNGQASVSWNAPGSNGGSAITGYKITPFIGATAQPAATYPGATTSRTVTGLTNGTAYTFKVQAVNAKGNSALSAASNVVTPSASTPPYAPYGSWTQLVDQVHRQLIGRLPTANERSQWLGPLQTGSKSPGDLVAALRQSSHHKNVVDQVTRLYRAYYLRSPDKGGLEYWIAQRLGGRTMVSISDFFSRSAEFIEIYGPLTNAEFVALVYQNVLDRPGSVADRNYWTSEISSGRRTRGTVMIGFSESAEYKGTQSSEVTVSVLYILWLDRVPTTQEFTNGVAALDGGMSVADYADSLLPQAHII